MQLTRNSGPIESKVAYPAIVTAVLRAGGTAFYGLALAEHWISPTPEQAAAIGGVGAWVLYAVGFIVGYLAPHTPRPDLADAGEDPVAPEPDDTSTQVTAENPGVAELADPTIIR